MIIFEMEQENNIITIHIKYNILIIIFIKKEKRTVPALFEDSIARFIICGATMKLIKKTSKGCDCTPEMMLS